MTAYLLNLKMAAAAILDFSHEVSTLPRIDASCWLSCVIQISSKSDNFCPSYCTLSISNMAAAAILNLSLQFRFLYVLTKLNALHLCIKFDWNRSNGLWFTALGWIQNGGGRHLGFLQFCLKVLCILFWGHWSLCACKIWWKWNKKQRNSSIFPEIKDGGRRHLGF